MNDKPNQTSPVGFQLKSAKAVTIRASVSVALAVLLACMVPPSAAAYEPCVAEAVPVLGGHCVHGDVVDGEDVYVPAFGTEDVAAYLVEHHYNNGAQEFDVYYVVPVGSDVRCVDIGDFVCTEEDVEPLVSGSISDSGIICSATAEIIIDDGDNDPTDDFSTGPMPYARLCSEPL